MTYAKMKNKAGKFVAADRRASFQAAAANADWKRSPASA